MKKLYVLFEHASGYAVFSVKEFEDVGMLLPQVEASVLDLSRFQSIVKLVGFSAFSKGVEALENINSVSEGIVPEKLKIFLDSCVPASTERNNVILGVGDTKLAAHITETLGIKCECSNAIPEIIRGIRHHFHQLVKGFTTKTIMVTQIGLAHSYSRAKVKFNVHREDNIIIQTISLIDQLDKDINIYSMRMREWYSYHFPELVKIVPENHIYAKVAELIKNRDDVTPDMVEKIEEIVMDDAKAQVILETAKKSMGIDIMSVDSDNIQTFAKRVTSWIEFRHKLLMYLKDKMSTAAPNLASLIGDQVGARLIAQAGSLTNLAKLPSSTVQILGAEKALFRALKTRGRTPKFGLLFNSTYIGRAFSKDKGRMSRFLANKCAMATRIDCFFDEPTDVFGKKLAQQVEDRLKFLASGEIPKKNIEVMKEALEESISEQKSKLSKKRKIKKKKEAFNNGVENGSDNVENGYIEETDSPIPKKKKKL